MIFFSMGDRAGVGPTRVNSECEYLTFGVENVCWILHLTHMELVIFESFKMLAGVGQSEWVTLIGGAILPSSVLHPDELPLMVTGVDLERTDHLRGLGVDGCQKAILVRCWSGNTSFVSVMSWFWLGFSPIVGVRGGAGRAVPPFRTTFSASLQLSHENLWCSC